MALALDTVLLPGLDGTGELFGAFVDRLSPELNPKIVAYPTDVPHGYVDLLGIVERSLPIDRPFAVVAESFSGPLAIRLAAKRTKGLVAIALVGSFVQHAARFIPRWARLFVGRHLFLLPPAAWAIRQFAAGPDAPDAIVADVSAALRRVKPVVLARRIREALSVDVVSDFLGAAVPMIYLAGKQDRLLRVGIAEELARLRPDLEIVRIEAPHFILQRAPTQAAAAISEFFLRCSSARREQTE